MTDFPTSARRGTDGAAQVPAGAAGVLNTYCD